jgi:hypothetical protein
MISRPAMFRVSADVMAIIAMFAGWHIACLRQCSRHCALALRPGMAFWRRMRFDNFARIRISVAAWGNLDATFPVTAAALYLSGEKMFEPPWGAVAAQDDPRSAEWLAARVGVLTHHRWELIKNAISEGYLEVAQRLYRAFLPSGDIENAQILMRAACRSGSLASIRWVESIGGRFSDSWFEVYGSGSMAMVRHFKKVSNPSLAFQAACSNGRLDVARWLTRRYYVWWRLGGSGVNQWIDAYLGWYGACYNGHFRIVRWLAKKLRLTASQVRGSFTLTAAAESGSLPLMQWLACKFDLTADDARSALRSVWVHPTAVARWMWRRFGLTTGDARDCRALRIACSHGDLDTVVWLFDVVGFTIGDIYESDNERTPLDLAEEYDVAYGSPPYSPSVIGWLRHRFGIEDPMRI